MLSLKRTNSTNKDFLQLVEQLDLDLAIRDGAEDHAFYAQFNKLDAIKNVILAYENGVPIGCGAFKKFDEEAVEIKRMYTLPQGRGKGVAFKILSALESWAKELTFQKCILETGQKQPEAIALYLKSGYTRMNKNYGQYEGVANSFCFEKKLES